MLKDIFDFIEVEDGFVSKDKTVTKIDFSQLKLLVKAYEKEIYDLTDNLILAKPHADNEGNYPYSKIDYLTHKLLELIFPDNVPKLFEAKFNGQTYIVIEKIDLDPLHKAYNIWRQEVHKKEGLKYDYDNSFLKVDDDITTLCKMHTEKVNQLQERHQNNLETYGITFDHSHVNVTWRDSGFVALELHKFQRDYLFNYDKCHNYFSQLKDVRREKGLEILRRIKELEVDIIREKKQNVEEQI